MNGNYEKARQRVAQKKQFYVQVLGYIVILGIGSLIFINPLSRWVAALGAWFFFVMLFCGLSLVYRYFKIFGLPEMISDLLAISHDWEEKAIQREMERLKANENTQQIEKEEFKLKNLQKEKLQPRDDSELV